MIAALIFDVDGTLAETEDLHLEAFNATFAEEGLSWHWDETLYRELLAVTGGKERMKAYAARLGEAMDDDRVARLHARKTEIYTTRLRTGALPLRPGIAELIAGAMGCGLRLAIATTTSVANVEALLAAAIGAKWRDFFSVIAAGDMVPAKKPAPDIYNLALERLQLAPGAAIAIDDSGNGIRAAKGAGLRVIATPGRWLGDEDLSAADTV
ncbi:MAG TPA: HAD-IA family hydrolase, partial [Rhabdaerophilum sp.]|nr:HAD-IA family hydrolase [Rhabdaerophilum sp.]